MYAHLSTVGVKVGQWIAGRTVLGSVGATGDAGRTSISKSVSAPRRSTRCVPSCRFPPESKRPNPADRRAAAIAEGQD
jgi:hypothetical protein